MRLFISTTIFYFFFQTGICLWSKGIVHYAINKKDYDFHSQDIIISTFGKIQQEVCVKFFYTPMNYTASNDDKILYISNVDKRKDCPPNGYNFTGSVVDMPIGYKCLNDRDIARIVVDMLRASIDPHTNINSVDLFKIFQNQETNTTKKLLSTKDRHFINTHYHSECGALGAHPVPSLRRFSGNIQMSEKNEEFYANKVWPFGIVMYDLDFNYRNQNTPEYTALRDAMSTIERSTCIVFREALDSDILKPKNLLMFNDIDGEAGPRLGFVKGEQKIHLPSFVKGAPGHTAHTLNMLMRVLGVPMMSNRYDRDSYVSINWKNVENGKEHYLERLPATAMLISAQEEGLPYDYDSVTHAPANFMCTDCSMGQQTVTPVQDHLWQRTMSMGHRTDLSESDVEMINLLYQKQCQMRFSNHKV